MSVLRISGRRYFKIMDLLILVKEKIDIIKRQDLSPVDTVLKYIRVKFKKVILFVIYVKKLLEHCQVKSTC